MRKLERPAIEEVAPPRRDRVRRALTTIALGLTVGPIVYEGSALCAARWRSMLGRPTVSASTPVLDTLVAGVTATAHAVESSSSHVFHNVPWRPSLVIPMAIAWAGCGSLILRRCGGSK